MNGKDTTFRIEVDLNACCGECKGFHYVVMAWHQYEIPKDGEFGFWHNTGICGIKKTPELAFADGLLRFKASGRLKE